MAEGFLPPVVVHLLADIKEFQAKMGEAKGEMDALSAKGATTGAALSKGLGLAALGIGGLAVGIGGLSIMLASKFEASVQRAGGQLGLTKDQTKALGTELSNLALGSEFSSQKVADAYAGVAGQVQQLAGGQDVAKSSTDILRASMELAVATGTDLQTTTGTLVGIMRTFQQPTSNASDIMATLYNTSKLTGNSMTQLVPALSKMGKSFAGVSPDVGDLASLMVDLSQHGINGSRAMMGVTSAFQKMLDPSFQAKAAAAGLNLQVYDAQGKFVGFRNVISQLTPQIAGLSQEQVQAKLSTAGFGSAAEALTPTLLAGVAGYDKATTAVKDHKGATKAAENQSKTFQGQIETFKSSFQTFAQQFGEQLLPLATKFLDFMNTQGVKDFKHFLRGLQGTGKKHDIFWQLGNDLRQFGNDLAAFAEKAKAVWDKIPGPLKPIIGGALVGTVVGGKTGGLPGAVIGGGAGATAGSVSGGIGAPAKGGPGALDQITSAVGGGMALGSIGFLGGPELGIPLAIAGGIAGGITSIGKQAVGGLMDLLFGPAGGTPAGAAEQPAGTPTPQAGAAGGAAIPMLSAIDSNTLSTAQTLSTSDGRLARHGASLEKIGNYSVFISQHTREANGRLQTIQRNTAKRDKINVKVRLV